MESIKACLSALIYVIVKGGKSGFYFFCEKNNKKKALLCIFSQKTLDNKKPILYLRLDLDRPTKKNVRNLSCCSLKTSLSKLPYTTTTVTEILKQTRLILPSFFSLFRTGNRIRILSIDKQTLFD